MVPWENQYCFIAGTAVFRFGCIYSFSPEFKFLSSYSTDKQAQLTLQWGEDLDADMCLHNEACDGKIWVNEDVVNGVKANIWILSYFHLDLFLLTLNLYHVQPWTHLVIVFFLCFSLTFTHLVINKLINRNKC